MQTRSRGSDNLIGLCDNINEIQRILRRQRQQATTEPSAETMAEPQVPARGVRPIGAGDAPNIHTQRQGIIPPAVQNNNFEIKLGMINLVQNKMFHGLPCEDPIDHLDEFDRLCNFTKVNGVSEDAVKLRLFPLTLGEKAHQWEKNLPHGSITTWDNCKKAFLAKFFSTGRTAKLRGEISGFHQKNGETFSEAWERFKGYTSQCPHHGFSNESLLSTLYRGVLPKYRQMLDTASNGDFLNQDVDDGWELVENIARSDGNFNEEYDRTNRSSIESESKLKKEVTALTEKIDKLILAQSSVKHVHFVSDEEFVQVQEGENEQQVEEVSYIQNNQGGYNKGFYTYKPNPNISYRSNNVANPQDQVYPPQQQQSQPQQHVFVPKSQFVQGQQGGYVQKQQLGAPPGFVPHQNQAQQVPETDMRAMLQQLLQGQANGVMETSKKFAEVNGKLESLNTRMTIIENNSASSSTAQHGQLPGKSVQNPKDHCHVVYSNADDEQAAENERAIQEITQLLYGCDDECSAASPTTLAEVEQLHSLGDTTDSVFGNDLLTRTSPNIPVPCQSVPPVSTRRIIPKLKDQGKFTLPCSLGHLQLDDALVDSGACVNLISLGMVQQLNAQSLMKGPGSSIMFGDASSKSPLGLLIDYPLMIGDCTIPTDLTVLDMVDKKEVPLILGTPFLSTAGASIDFPSKLVILHNVNSNVSYPLKRTTTKYCGTITTAEFESNVISSGVIEYGQVLHRESPLPVEIEPGIFDGEGLSNLFTEPLGRAQKEGVSMVSITPRKENRKTNQPQPIPSTPSQPTVSLLPLELKGGKLHYEVKFKGRSKPFASARAIVNPELQNDPMKLKELLSTVLSITLKDGTGAKPH